MNSAFDKKALESIKKRIEGDALFAFVLGSFGTERFHKESDIDIAAFFEPKLGFDEKAKISNDLAEQLDREVDLVDLNGVDPIFARQVLETGRLIFSSDPEKLLLWKQNVLSIYPDFKRSREIIEKNLLKRKKRHG